MPGKSHATTEFPSSRFTVRSDFTARASSAPSLRQAQQTSDRPESRPGFSASSHTDSHMRRKAVTEFGAGGPHDTERPDIYTASDGYAHRRFRGAIGAWLLGEQQSAIGRLLDRTDRQPLRILDVGGGHAQLTELFVQRGHQVVVHGSAEVCFARVAAVQSAYPGSVIPCVSNVLALPFADRAFDLAVAVRLFGHVERWHELLAEMTRVSARYVMIEFARANGALTATLPGLTDTIFALKRRVEKTTRPFFAYRQESLVEGLLANGFRLVALEAQFALPMVIHRLGGAPRVSRAVESALRSVGIGARFRSPAILLAERTSGRSPNGNGAHR